MPRFFNGSDYRAAARKRLPRGLFEYIDRGTEDETALVRLRSSLDSIVLRPSILSGTTPRSLEVDVLGRTLAAPLVIAPTALAGIVAHDGELALARAAATLDIPICVSTQSVTTIEAIRAAAPDANLWFQLYVWNDRTRTMDLLDRVREQGCECLILTVDTPVGPNREYNTRNGFAVPFRPGLRNVLDIALHPRWAVGTLLRQVLRDGVPSYGHYPPDFRRNILDPSTAEGLELHRGLKWSDVETLRRYWSGRLVLKGVLSLSDALRARDLGVDGIVVSSHGGRNFDALPSPATELSAIADALGSQLAILADSGVRRGSDVLKYVALGAKAVLVGRLPLWGLAVDGERGAAAVLRILLNEMATGMAFLGTADPSELRGRAAVSWPPQQ